MKPCPKALLRALAACLLLGAVLLSWSCGADQAGVLPRTELFELRLGKLPDAVDLFQPGGLKSQRKNRLFMRNGIFYLTNGNANKVMELSSYGDLLTLIYSPQDNPKPLRGTAEQGSGRISNKQMVPYSFQACGELATTRSGLLLVEDQAPQTRSVRDPVLDSVLSNVILRFSPERQYMDYLGQEGIGGSPFPYIVGLHVTEHDDIVVVCRTVEQWLVYWFSVAGTRKYAFAFDPAHLPSAGEGYYPSLAAIKPDPDMPYLYLSVNYYPVGEAQTSQRSGDEARRVESRLYTLNVGSGAYIDRFSLPYETQRLAGGSEFEPAAVQSLPEFQGAIQGGSFVFTSHVADDRYLLTVLDRNGRVLHKRTLLIEDSLLVDRVLSLSAEGVLSAFLGYEDHAALAWWRTDSLSGHANASR